MTIMLSFGKWAGFYIRSGHTFRICLGWMALTIVPQDIDHLLHMNKVYRGLMESMGEQIAERMIHGPKGGDRNV